ncbi:MAG: YkgJ family cysteine cluster protein [Armatimonadota bacterium]|jgi:Fe-S-cluster containining protein|nr:YkgJ family cysteine cluster protein [Armatimonadota bacterium]
MRRQTGSHPEMAIGPIPRVITDAAALAQRARDGARDTVKFRAWVKFRSTLPDQDLEAMVRAVADAVWRQVDCTACGRCCQVLEVSLDDEDIARLAKRFGLSPRAFARRYVAGRGKERCFGARPCPFLRGNVCSVYAERPKACRDFPYLHAPGFRERLLLLMDYSFFCPIVLNTLEVLKRRLPWRHSAKPHRSGAPTLQERGLSADNTE